MTLKYAVTQSSRSAEYRNLNVTTAGGRAFADNKKACRELVAAVRDAGGKALLVQTRHHVECTDRGDFDVVRTLVLLTGVVDPARFVRKAEGGRLSEVASGF